MDKVVQMYEMAASQKVQRLIVVLIVFTLSSVAIFAIGWRAYGHYIAKPLQVVVAALDQVAGGDLSNPKIPIKSSDEIGQLSAAINSMVEGLRERDRIKDLFGRFQTVEVMDSLLKMPENFQLSGERRKITIMFTDLRGFTTLSDSIEPEQVVRILNQYFESMFGICQKYKGIINEILG
ncbi:MAG: adenylate/guanylate cyclase domain-containing protein, partial [Deltaproteobacteria bacterium]|nr:adenylate/guanylate cyclase domain-containing protein [Deltaproteobacteria bacterium]